MNIVAIVLTFNSEASIAQVIESCQELVARILVVDSYSSDRSLDIVRSYRCELVQHEFKNYSKQRNWAQDYANLAPEDWVLHLDSDEVISPELAASIRQLKASDSEPDVDGYLIRRLSYFLGKPIRYGNINPSWHLRLFRAKCGQCEERLYDQHYIVPGATRKLAGTMLDLQLTSLETWTASHNRWSTAEAAEVNRRISQAKEEAQTLPATLRGDIRMKKRWLKNNIWYKSPPLLRPFLFFFYSYFLRLGFLDGRAGLIFHVLQSFWFRFLVDAKLVELHMQQDRQDPLESTSQPQQESA
ncbi:glycosyltransferase family 2 protein [Synechococcus sp. PCC 7336]|uniref:glycosyltransferase family 2 protein n=1 Tax=Synechococcus sp. PCC 7336 TaxID=195250 RepID=UPI000344C53E|nr:glycosyltransferase family 2 protein [Synechococcus sp. PCC 7336]